MSNVCEHMRNKIIKKLLFKRKFGAQNICLDINITFYLLIQFQFLAHDKEKLVSHWDATTSRLVGDKGLRYKRDFLPFFTLRSHWTL